MTTVVALALASDPRPDDNNVVAGWVGHPSNGSDGGDSFGCARSHASYSSPSLRGMCPRLVRNSSTASAMASRSSCACWRASVMSR